MDCKGWKDRTTIDTNISCCPRLPRRPQLDQQLFQKGEIGDALMTKGLIDLAVLNSLKDVENGARCLD